MLTTCVLCASCVSHVLAIATCVLRALHSSHFMCCAVLLHVQGAPGGPAGINLITCRCINSVDEVSRRRGASVIYVHDPLARKMHRGYKRTSFSRLVVLAWVSCVCLAQA